MKRLVLGALTSLSIVGFAGQATAADFVDAPQGLIFGGYVDLEFGARYVKSTDDPSDNTHFTTSGTGAYNVPLSDNISAQVDFQAEYYADDADDEAASHALAFGGHLSWRDPNSGLFGVFVGGANGDSLRGDETGGDDLGFFVGAEAQIYLDEFTFYAQGGYADYTTDGGQNEGFQDGWFVRGIGRYFLTDDMMFEAEFAYGESDNFIDNNGTNGKIWNWGAKGKWRIMDDMPLYGIVNYRGGRYSAPSDSDRAVEHAVLAGVSFMMGATSLKENDRYGATLVSPMIVSRAAAWVEPLD
jgi:hypothetical protein